MDALNTTETAMASPRSLMCHYNPSMVAAALAVSLLGAFTSTQLMCQARSARTLSGVLIWTVLGSLVFGFCATWCLHFLGMLSCEFDVPIGLNASLTVLSAVLAVCFTYGALSIELVQKRWGRSRRKRVTFRRQPSTVVDYRLNSDLGYQQSSETLLRPSHKRARSRTGGDVADNAVTRSSQSTYVDQSQGRILSIDDPLADFAAAHSSFKRTEVHEGMGHPTGSPFSNTNQTDYDDADSDDASSTAESQSRLLLNNSYSVEGTARISGMRSNTVFEANPTLAGNALLFSAVAVLNGFTLVNVTKGFVWSIALTNMHFMGVKALEIPNGFVALSPARVILCELTSWSVCCVGVILMAEMEVNIKQQVLFSVIAATGVAAVHFSGMYACSFWSMEDPSSRRGYPVALPIVIASVALLTCMVSTGLLAHSATIARDKLAEVLYTRRRLWDAIAQKESAEAAVATSSEFIASASHEIRTPLHQLQGYTDLLSKSELSEEDRSLLIAIQHATRSLAMITSNVLDWSRLEKGEAICRPVLFDIRLACEAVVHLLPNRDDNSETELLVVVAPEVPSSVFVDETYLQRVLMNLLSNSSKFTISGYVMLLLRLKEGILHLTVKDSGSGIPQSFLPQLFEPYKQVQARGAERGTGLGLSITERLVQRMQGSITVRSKYQLDQDVGVANSGSEFMLTIPIAISEHPSDAQSSDFVRSVRIAIIHDGRHRDIEALTTAWTSFGAEVSHAQVLTDIPSDPDTIIWADLYFLQKHHATCFNILRQEQHLVLVPYRDRALLDRILGPTPPTNIVPVRKPLIWHRIVQAIIDVQQIRSTPVLDKDIKLAPKLDVVQSSANESKMQAPVASKRTILLVEDNKINQKLGAKMLTMLNYDVLLAEDGQEAIDIVMEHALTIDAILMDQSMPRKDGITATKEIRELEAAGLLHKRLPIIAVTAAAGPEAQAQFLEAGTDMFVPKPLSLAKLEQTLSHYFVG